MAMQSGVPGSVRRRVFARDGYQCLSCGLTGWEERTPGGAFVHPTRVPGVHLSIDHVIPRSRGGSAHPDNLETTCTTCNTKKGAKVGPWFRDEVAA